MYGRGSYSTGSSGFQRAAISRTRSRQWIERHTAICNSSERRIYLQSNNAAERQLRFRTPGDHQRSFLRASISHRLGSRTVVRHRNNLEFPDIQFAGNTNLSKLGQAIFTTLNMIPYSHIIRPDVTKVFSSHTLKLAASSEALYELPPARAAVGIVYVQLQHTQRVIGAAASQTQGNGFSSFLLGIPANGNMEHTFATAAASEYYGFYVQDDWKATRKLTLNIGLRYDIDVPRTERYNRLSYFDIDAPSPIAGRVLGYDNLKGAMRFTSPDHRRQTHRPEQLGTAIRLRLSVHREIGIRGAYALMYSGSVMQAAGTSGSSGTEGFTGSTNMIVSNNGGRTAEAYLSNP